MGGGQGGATERSRTCFDADSMPRDCRFGYPIWEADRSIAKEQLAWVAQFR